MAMVSPGPGGPVSATKISDSTAPSPAFAVCIKMKRRRWKRSSSAGLAMMVPAISGFPHQGRMVGKSLPNKLNEA